jgi:hypothetical protein
MPIAAALGETLVGLDELDEVAGSSGDEIREFVDKSEPDPGFALTVDGNVTIGPAELAKAREAKSSAIPYEGIGVGKPLTIVIETIYLGDYPDAMPWVPYFQGGDVLVTSAHKAFESFDAAPRGGAPPRGGRRAPNVTQGEGDAPGLAACVLLAGRHRSEHPLLRRAEPRP